MRELHDTPREESQKEAKQQAAVLDLEEYQKLNRNCRNVLNVIEVKDIENLIYK